MTNETSKVLTLVFTDLADSVGRFATLQAEALLRQVLARTNDD